MTITEIANMAGVSVSAVSRYLNHGYISEEKQKKIKEVIEKTGYKPSKQAQILRTKKSKVVGVILPKISSEAIARVADGISSVLSEAGYQMLLASTENDPKKEIEYLQLLDKNPVDGILFSASIYDKAHQKALKKLNAPIVIVSQKFEGQACVYHDDYGAAKKMTSLLLESGKKHPAHIRVLEEDAAAGLARTRGYLDALEEAGMGAETERIELSTFSMESGYEKMKKILDTYPETDAVFCATDTIAIGAISYLHDIGKQIPKDIAIAGIGHNKMSRVIQPKLCTAHLAYRTSGIEAAKMLLEMIEDKSILPKQMKLGYEIIKGDSI